MPRLVISPDAIVRLQRGVLVAHNGHARHPPVGLGDGGALSALRMFAAPADPAVLRARVPPAGQAGFDRFIATLQQAGILVEADVPADRDAADDACTVQQQLGLLAQTLADLAADCAALDPEALTGLAAQDGIGVPQRLEAIVRAVGDLRDRVATAADSAASDRLRQLDAEGRLQDAMLHIGAGGHHLPGWINIDAHPADLALNVGRRLPFADGTARLIFASHVLEHLYYPAPALRFLAECLRVLRPGGRIRLIVPDIERYIRAYADGDQAFFDARRGIWQGLPAGRTLLEEFLTYAGAGPDPAAFLDGHKYAYDYATLHRMLERAGFVGVERSDYMASMQAELRVDDASSVAGASAAGRHYSLFVEAVRPVASSLP